MFASGVQVMAHIYLALEILPSWRFVFHAFPQSLVYPFPLIARIFARPIQYVSPYTPVCSTCAYMFA